VRTSRITRVTAAELESSLDSSYLGLTLRVALASALAWQFVLFSPVTWADLPQPLPEADSLPGQ
jgi:hypothetical protein